jgi:hypothetical protein
MYQLVSNLFTKLLHRLGPLYYNDGRDFSRSLETHGELLNALEVRDPARARHVLERMLAYSESAIVGEIGRLEAEGRIGPQTRAPLEGRGEATRNTREREPSAVVVASSRPAGPGIQS